MRTSIRLEQTDSQLVVGVVEALGVAIAPSPAALSDGLDALLALRSR